MTRRKLSDSEALRAGLDELADGRLLPEGSLEVVIEERKLFDSDRDFSGSAAVAADGREEEEPTHGSPRAGDA